MKDDETEVEGGQMRIGSHKVYMLCGGAVLNATFN